MGPSCSATGPGQGSKVLPEMGPTKGPDPQGKGKAGRKTGWTSEIPAKAGKLGCGSTSAAWPGLSVSGLLGRVVGETPGQLIRGIKALLLPA